VEHGNHSPDHLPVAVIASNEDAGEGPSLIGVLIILVAVNAALVVVAAATRETEYRHPSGGPKAKLH